MLRPCGEFGRQNLPDGCGRADEEGRFEDEGALEWHSLSNFGRGGTGQVFPREQGLQIFRHEARRLGPHRKDFPNLSVRTHVCDLAFPPQD